MKQFFVVLASIVAFFLLLFGFIEANRQHMESIETYAKDVEYHRLYLAGCQHDIALMEGRCERNNIKVKDLVSEDTYLYRLNFINDLKQLKAELEKREKILHAIQERYLRSIADKEDNIQSVLVNDGFVTISYYQVVDYDGRQEDELWESNKMDLWQAMNAVEDGMFRYGRFTMYHQTINVRMEGTL